MEKVENKKGLVEKVFLKVNSIDKVLESRVDTILLRFINMLKYFFILIMIVYLAICLLSLGHKIVSFTLAQGALDFASIKTILTDGLFTLIVILESFTKLVNTVILNKIIKATNNNKNQRKSLTHLISSL